MAFAVPLDIATRTLQLLGLDPITLTDFNGSPFVTKAAVNLNSSYDKIRLAELRRNLWVFCTRRVILRAIDIDTVLWTPPVWAAGAFGVGAVVQYTPTTGPYTGKASYWELSVAEPGSSVSPDLDPLWHHYCGPLAVDLYNTGLSGTGSTSQVNDSQNYQSGELALVPASYAGGTTYGINNVVNSGGQWYVSLINANVGNTPSSSPTAWALWTSQGRGNGLYGLTATKSPIPLIFPVGWSVYRSLYNNNADNPVNGTLNWINVGGSITPLQISWPIGTGPLYDTATSMNAFYLPSGFLKRAPTSPKQGQTGYLGANSGSMPEDYIIENGVLVSSNAGPIMIRCIFDMTDVSEFDPMFCEGFAISLALENCEILTEKEDLDAKLERRYGRKMGEARAADAIENGPITPVENRYVTVRV